MNTGETQTSLLREIFLMSIPKLCTVVKKRMMIEDPSRPWLGVGEQWLDGRALVYA